MSLPAHQTKQKHRTTILLLLLCCIFFLLLTMCIRARPSPGTSLCSFLYPEGDATAFALAGDKLALASSQRVQLLSPEGALLFTRELLCEQPVISSGDAACLFTGTGSHEALIWDERHGCRTLDWEQSVRFAHMGSDGSLCVITDLEGYQGRVWVYDRALEPVFTFDSGLSGYPICARLSGDGRLAVLCVEEAGSVLRVFTLESETELFSCRIPDTLALDMAFMSGGTLALLSEGALYLLDEQGKPTERVDFPQALVDYALGADFAALLFREDEKDTLWCVRPSGRLCGRLESEEAVLGLSLVRDQVLILRENSLELYRRSLRPLSEEMPCANIRRALLRKDGSAVLAGGSGAMIAALG